jgi:tetratricopeptide (TPR) repeat protein
MMDTTMRRWLQRVMLSACLSAALCACVLGQGGDSFPKGMAAYQSGDYPLAAQLFEQAEAEAPGTTDALLYAGRSFVRLQSYVKAEQAFREYLEKNPISSDGYYLLGYVLNRENKPKESLEIYTRAAFHAPPTADDLKVVALNYVLLNDNEDAIRWLQRAVEMDPRNNEAWYFLGRAYYTETRLPEARKAYEKVLELDPHNAKAENNIGLIEESSGKPEQALDAYRRAIAWQEGSVRPSEQPYLNLGNLLITLEQPAEAIAPLERAVALAGNNSQCRLRLGTAYLRVGRLKEAQVQLEESVRLDPEDPAAHYQLGRYYKQVHQAEAAKAEFDKVANIQSRALEKQMAPAPK